MNDRVKARQYVEAHFRNPRDASLALYAGEALLGAGAAEEAVAVWSFGDEADPQMRHLKDHPKAPAEARALSACADAAFRRHFTKLHIAAVDAFAREQRAQIGRVRDSVWPLTHDGPIDYRTPLQCPVIFYMPDLPASPVEPIERFPWAENLRARWRDIRAEYETAVAGDAPMTPYVPAETQEEKWRNLRGKEDWSSIHLFKNQAPTSHAERFPETLAALSGVNLLKVNGVPVEVFFSRLKAGAHIPPHHGLTNTRVTVHLPLIVPEGCFIRVGDYMHHWREGEIVAFDDSFEHEAWNRSASDRVVLIFEAHHPDLSPAEQKAIEYAYRVRQNWLTGRRALLERYLARR